MRTFMSLTGVTLAVGVVAVAAQASGPHSPAQASPAPVAVAAPAPTTANVEMPTLTADEQKMLAARFSPERLAAIRARVQGDAQRTVRDDADGVFREPTAEEAAVLARPAAADASVAVTLGNGGQALKADASSVEFVKATVGSDGAVVTHDGKGGRRDQ